MDITVEGIDPVDQNDSGPSDVNIYSYAIITISSVDGMFGKEDLTMELNLKNFLSTITI